MALLPHAIAIILAVVCIVTIYKYMRLVSYVKSLQNDIDLFTDTPQEMVKGSASSSKEDPQDSLTNLPHRSVFDDRLSQILQQSSRTDRLFAIVAIDVDDFSKIRELGATAGDELLKQLALRLQMSIRQVDTLARVGGANFILLLPVLSRPETAVYVAQRIQDNLYESFKLGDAECKVTVSMGVSVYPVDGDDAVQLIQRSNHALQQAKQSGKNQYQFYQDELHDLSSRELSIANFVRSNSFMSSLKVQYKPYFDADKGEPFYIQSSVHLHHPQHGMISFTDIMDIADNSGKMLDVNNWLLDTSLEQLHDWRKDNFNPLYLAITVRMHQLENSNFVYRLIAFSKELSKISVHLILDIEDQEVTQNTNYIEGLFSQLSDAGIHIAVGIIALGNFAMQKFSRIPLSYLKIDRKLVKEAAANAAKHTVLSRIVQLADNESIIVMAEGVDTEADKQRLLKIGCQMMEGKLFGVMMPTGAVLQKTED